jgi:hypothetical protein
MLELFMVLATTILPVLVVIAKDVYAKRKEETTQNAPMLRQEQVDVEILLDKPAFSVRLGRLHERLRVYRRPAQ